MLFATCASCGTANALNLSACTQCGGSDMRQGDWMQTYTGKPFWILDPRPADVDINDIAHHLSMICRFGGACNFHYSIAQHSVHVAAYMGRYLTDPKWQQDPRSYLCGLLHDGHEAYTGDDVRPKKRSIPQLSTIESKVQHAVLEAFDLLEVWPHVKEAVKRADVALLATERRDIMAPSTFGWAFDEQPIEDLTINPNPGIKAIFLQLFNSLR